MAKSKLLRRMFPEVATTMCRWDHLSSLIIFLSMFIIDTRIMDLASKSSIPVHRRQAVARCLPNGLSALQDYQPGWKLRNRMSQAQHGTASSQGNLSNKMYASNIQRKLDLDRDKRHRSFAVKGPTWQRPRRWMREQGRQHPGYCIGCNMVQYVVYVVYKMN